MYYNQKQIIKYKLDLLKQNKNSCYNHCSRITIIVHFYLLVLNFFNLVTTIIVKENT